MNEEVMTSDSELYNSIVEMLSNGNFLQLNGKAINLTELNEYINAQQEEIERLNTIINKAIEYIEDSLYVNKETGEYVLTHTFDNSNLYELLKILDNGE